MNEMKSGIRQWHSAVAKDSAVIGHNEILVSRRQLYVGGTR
jgi:hypothetical protein